MVNNYIKRLGALFASALLIAGSGARADDTEIYFQGANTGVTPVVMFYIEYSPNLTSTICTGLATDGSDIDTKCPVMSNLKLYLAKPNTDSSSKFYNPTASNDLADGVIDQFEMTRAALKRVLIALGNMKIGLITAHNADNNCAGPSVTGCSNGAEIFERAVLLRPVSDIVANFNPLSQSNRDTVLDQDDNKRELFRKLDRMRSPQGNFTAPNQNKEVYFELYRYLTGKNIYNGHNGWNDFGTKLLDNGTYNLGDWYNKDANGTPINNGRYICQSGSTCTSANSGGIYLDATKQGQSYKGDFNGDFIVTSGGGVNPTTYISSYAFKWDANAENGNQYISPIDADCQKIFMINIVDGAGISANDSDTAIKASYSNGGMNLNVSLGDAGFVDMARWLFDSDLADGTISPSKESKQNVTSYFVAKHTDQVNAAALAGTGGSTPALPLTGDPQSVVDALNKVFNQILSVSTTFVAASIPVNVFNRSEVIDNAYIALFQANASGQPQWVGNVKKLKLDIYQVQVPAGTDPVTGATIYTTQNRLQLIDTNPDNIDTDPSTAVIDPPSAIATDGRIIQSARTFWTHSLGYDLYDNISSSAQEVAGRDGRSVNRGGAGENIPGFLASTTSLIGTANLYAAGTGSLKNDGSVLGSSNPRKLWTNKPNNTLITLDMDNANDLWPMIFDTTDAASKAPWNKATDFTSLTGDFANNDWSLTYLPADCFTYFNIDSTTSNVAPSSYTGSSSAPGACLIADELSNVIAFIRGLDTGAIVTDPVTGLTDTAATNAKRNLTRRWAFGDPLHSRPVPINYGARSGYSTTNPDIRIVVGSNDGFLRMIRNTNTNGTESGEEMWAFMPKEMLRMQKKLKDNIATSPATHPYGLDGSPTAYIVDDNGTVGDAATDKAWVFFGLRRGGRALYAMDITNPDTPVLKWSINQNTSGFSELGYTFSQPVVRELDWGNGKKPVVIIGGGYDTNKDMAGLGTDDSMGNAIFIIDADTGALVWKAVKTASTGTVKINAGLVDSIPSDVTAYDSSGDGLVDRIYVGDTGGSVWRLDLPTNNTADWTITKVLNVGRHISGATTADDRRFFTAPDVVPSRDTAGLFDAVVIGSGNREHPLFTGTNDWLYTYKDRAISTIASGFTALNHGDLTDITHLNDCLIAATCKPDLTKGWKLQLTVSGEKALSSALTLRGVVYFNSYIPKTTGCGPNEGTGRLYEVALSNGTAVYNFTTVNDTGGKEVLGESDRFRELASGGIPAENVYVSFRQGTETFTGILAPDLNAGQDLGVQSWNTYWFEKQR